MRIRHRLSLAFFLISVLPLAVVTAYSYYSSAAALRRAAAEQADQMAMEMGERMTFVLADLGDRVQRIWQTRSARSAADASRAVPPRTAAAPVKPAEGEPDARENTRLLAQLQTQVNEALAEAAPMVEWLEFKPSAPPPPAAPEPDAQPRTGLQGPGRGAPALPRPSRRPPTESWFPPGDPAGASRVVVDVRPSKPRPPGAAPGTVPGAGSRTRMDVVPFATPSRENIEAWRRAVQQQMEADRLRRGAATGNGSPMAGPDPAREAARMKRRAEQQQRLKALAAGEAVKFSVQMDGAVVGEVNAQVNRHRMIETVLSLARRERGEVPFVLDIDDEIHAMGAEDAKLVEGFGLDRRQLASLPGQTSRTVRDWVVVTRHDESGIVFGIARPLAASLRDMRRSALSNLGIGLLLIVASFAVILPLAGSLTRHITTLTDGVQRLARGERGTRVPVTSRDEVGELTHAFNQMAGELEAHEKVVVERERLRRELELCRQIQVDMLPREPLRMGLAEVTGVSIPAREVGGDFFNYFGLPGGSIALLVGDVSGKGVGAALLMANVQATLRARLPLELDLPALVDALDRDVAENTPSEVYLTLFIAILDPVRGLLRYVNAGHNPQYLLHAKGDAMEAMGATGLPVGMLAGHGYEQRTTRVHPGDLLFLYTDGATEAEDASGDMFGHDRLQQALAAAPAAAGAAEVLASVETVIREFRGAIEPFDDATMMAVRVGGGPPA